MTSSWCGIPCTTEKGVTGHWETGVANKLNGTEDDQITGEAREVWDRQKLKTPGGMEEIREAAIKEVNDKVATGELTCFEDVRKLIKHPRTAAQYRYDEELSGDSIFPKKGQHWATTVDKALLE